MTDLLLEEARNQQKTWFKEVETHEGLVAWAEKTVEFIKRERITKTVVIKERSNEKGNNIAD